MKFSTIFFTIKERNENNSSKQKQKAEFFSKNQKMSPKPANYSPLPAYTTITAQSFTKDGLYLAVGNDQGRLAIFKVMQILEKNQPTLIFQFEAASILDQAVNQTRFKGCINSMKTLKETLIVAISRPASNEAAIVAFHWKDLIQQKSKLAWNIESSSGLLPTDVNSIDVDEIDEKLFIVGGKMKYITLKNIFPFFAMLHT